MNTKTSNTILSILVGVLMALALAFSSIQTARAATCTVTSSADSGRHAAAIGRHGLDVIKAMAAKKRPGETINILTHCNAGWLATVDWGTALAPVYAAFDAGIPVHVWVSETRPRNQGAALTAWELAQHGVPHTVIADNAAGHLMRHGQVDLVIVGADRAAANGDVANKIGRTYLKALAGHDNGVPFYAAVPGPTIDWRLADGSGIPIEERAASEVTHIQGRAEDGSVTSVRLVGARARGSLTMTAAFLCTLRGLVAANPHRRSLALRAAGGPPFRATPPLPRRQAGTGRRRVGALRSARVPQRSDRGVPAAALPRPWL